MNLNSLFIEPHPRLLRMEKEQWYSNSSVIGNAVKQSLKMTLE